MISFVVYSSSPYYGSFLVMPGSSYDGSQEVIGLTVCLPCDCCNLMRTGLKGCVCWHVV